VARSLRSLALSGASPLGFPYTLTRADLRLTGNNKNIGKVRKTATGVEFFSPEERALNLQDARAGRGRQGREHVTESL
jgi:hypothetical protein